MLDITVPLSDGLMCSGEGVAVVPPGGEEVREDWRK